MKKILKGMIWGIVLSLNVFVFYLCFRTDEYDRYTDLIISTVILNTNMSPSGISGNPWTDTVSGLTMAIVSRDGEFPNKKRLMISDGSIVFLSEYWDHVPQPLPFLSETSHGDAKNLEYVLFRRGKENIPIEMTPALSEKYREFIRKEYDSLVKSVSKANYQTKSD